ncbi:MAG: hypothetical protein Q9162_004601 [Coniocarpon cinnabarinum]
MGGAVAIVCDFGFALLPILFMWNIQMKTTIKIGVGAIMSLGVLTGACAAARVGLLHRYFDADNTYNIVDLAILAVVEAATAIIAATIPALSPLVMRSKSTNTDSLFSGSRKMRPGYEDMTSKTAVADENQTSVSNTLDHQKLISSSQNTPYMTSAHASGGENISRSNNDLSFVEMGQIGKRVDLMVT